MTVTSKVSSFRENRFLVRAIVASQFAPPFMFSGVAVALPAMGADLNAGATSLGLVETLFLAGSLAFLLPVGRLADAGDKSSLYKLGLLAFAVSSILIGLLSWMPAILVLRFLQGASSAVFAATGPAILADIVPESGRGRAYGSSMGAIYSGLTLGPIAAGWLIDLWGWRAVFLAGAGVLSVGLLLVLFMLPSAWRRPGNAVHLPSAFLSAAAVLSLVAGSATLREGTAGYGFLTAGPVLAVIFVLWQRRLERPLLNVDALLRNRVLRNALTVQWLLYMNAFATVFMLSIYMQVTLQQSAKMAGQVLAIGTVLMALMAPVSGRLADRYRPRRISSLGVACVLISAAIATTLDASSSLTFVILVLAVQGLGFAFFSSPNMKIIMGSAPAHVITLVSALAAKSRALGMVSGMLVTAVLVSLEIGNDPVEAHPLRFVDVMETAFSILAVLTALALAFCLRTRSPAPEVGG